MLPLALTKPLLNKFAPVMLAPLIVPFTLNPEVVKTATLDTALTDTDTLALADPMFTLLVPFIILDTVVMIPVNSAPLP